MQLTRAEYRVEGDADEVDAGGRDEDVAPAVGIAVPGDVVHEDGHEEAGYGTDAVGHAHEDTGVPRRDIQVINVEARDGEAAAGDADGQCQGGACPVPASRAAGHHQEEERLHAEAAAVKELAHVRRAHDSALTQVIGQQTAAGHDHRHQQVRQSTQYTRLQLEIRVLMRITFSRMVREKDLLHEILDC